MGWGLELLCRSFYYAVTELDKLIMMTMMMMMKKTTRMIGETA
jgi:hypothetical protein